MYGAILAGVEMGILNCCFDVLLLCCLGGGGGGGREWFTYIHRRIVLPLDRIYSIDVRFSCFHGHVHVHVDSLSCMSYAVH